MRIVRAGGDLVAAVRRTRAEGGSVGLVPTMGALHAGHLSLLAEARPRHELLVMSVFVNPLQFDRVADLERYPRDLDADADVASGAGVDLCFAPSVTEMYPDGDPVVRVDPGWLGASYEGASRPGHLSGMATVVTKLLALVGPDAAYFGEKDFQQLVIVTRLARDLSLPVEIVGCPTLRESDGLALSSRNQQLSRPERTAATVLYSALLAGREVVERGGRREQVEAAMASVVATEPLARLDYCAVVTPLLTVPTEPLSGPVRLLVAAHLGAVRLIDNLAATA